MTIAQRAAAIGGNKKKEGRIMPDQPSDPLRNIMGRCTATAWDTLKHLTEHPMFPELIARLEKINGQVVSVDVERVARQLNDLRNESRPL